VSLKRDHGISRTVPAVGDGYVVTLGPAGQVMCCDALTGDFRWGIDLVADFGTVRPRWYAGQCPLIDGDHAVIAACGSDVLLMGVDLATGRIAWRTPNPRGLEMSHSSIVTTTIEGVRMYVYAAVNGIVGVSAETSDRGALLWDARGLDVTVIAPSPVPLDDGKIFMTAGYGGGSLLLRVAGNGGTFTASEIGRWPAEEGFSSEQQTPVVLDGRLVSILPDSAGPRRGQLACWDPATASWTWLSGQDRRFGQYGPFLVADGKLLILDQDGTLTIAEASTEAYVPLGSAKILEGPDAWAPMALVAGRLIARDTHRMVCLDLRGDR
jgi:outer membrane protein assembly factor BamB